MQRRRSWSAATALAVLLLSLAACGVGSGGSKPKAAGTTAPAKAPIVDPASVKANELGEVPVMMYHRLTATPKGEYDRTPADFRAELERLYASGYRPVLARDLVAGTMDVPAGTTPVVLTFDDGTISQYRLGPDGSVAPDTAVGILLEFAKGHPDFRPVATMRP